MASICWRDGQKRSMNAERLLRSDWNAVLYSLVYHEPLREKTSWKSSNFSLRTSLSSFLLAQPKGVLPALGQATLYDQLAQHGATLANKLRHSPGVKKKKGRAAHDNGGWRWRWRWWRWWWWWWRWLWWWWWWWWIWRWSWWWWWWWMMNDEWWMMNV